ncbi:MAG: MBG domain-containing protein, partial [Bacteroidota bacterium]
ATSGLISGTPTTVESSSNIVVKVTDSGGSIAYETYTVTIGAGPPSATTRPASSVATTSATLNALVIANGADATVSWCMSTDAATNADGSLFSCTQFSVSASPSSVLAAASITSITGSATSLTNNTIYYFQVKAVNTQGTRYGDILSFETNSRSSQSALTVSIGTASKTYPYSLALTLSTTGGSTGGTVTYEIVPGGTADDCLLSNSSASATITASTSGTCLIQGTMAGNASFNPVTSTSATFTFNKATLTVTPSSHTVTYGSAKPTITPSYSGFVNSETVDSPTVSANLVAPTCSTTYQDTTTVGASTTTSCTGGSARNYTLSTTATGSVTVTQASQTVSFTSSVPSPALVGSNYTPTGTASSGLAVAITLAAATHCSIAAGVVTFNSAGNCTINLNQSGDSNYSAASQVQQSFTISVVKTAQAAVTFSTTSYTKVYGETVTVTATGGSGSGAYVYSHGSSTACTVNSSTGEVTITSGTGTCSITSYKSGDDTYNDSAVTATPVTVTVGKANQTISITSLGTSSKTAPYTQALSITTSGSSGTGAKTYAISSGGTATACALSNSTNTATITATTSGTCLITANIATDTNYESATSSAATFTFSKATQSAVTFATTSYTKVYGETLTVTASGGSGSGSYVYSSGSSDACTVNSSTGVVTITSGTPGTCSITATRAADDEYEVSSASATPVTITVGKASRTI